MPNINYDNFIPSILPGKVISTWLDDEDKNKQAIASYVINKCGSEKPIQKIKHPKYDNYMAKELHLIGGIKVIYQNGMPDGICFLESDMERLLKVCL